MITKHIVDIRDSFDDLYAATEPYKTSKVKQMIDKLQREVYLKEQFSGRLYICPISGERLRSHQDVDVCHFIDRSHMTLRWSDRNCLLCSRRSNRVDSNIPHPTSRSKHHYDYEQYLGLDEVNWLKDQGREVIPWSRTDYVNQLQVYLKRLYG